MFRSLSVLVLVLCFLVSQEAKSIDPYKVLGLDKNASQRDIQKAFHRLSLKYHPDKNKEKGAQEKFSEINNAYEILSDEEKRKNYDLFGDEKASPNFGGGTSSHGDSDGYTFTTGGQGKSHFSSNPGGWQTMGGHGNSKSFSFSFGGPSASGNSFGFGLDDIFSNFFGGDQSSWAKSKSQFRSSGTIQTVNTEFFTKNILDHGMTWLLLVYTPSTNAYEALESIMLEVAHSLQGAIKVGGINCRNEQALCKDLGISPSKLSRVFIYSYKTAKSGGSLQEYNDEWDGKRLKKFCLDHLPKISSRVDLRQLDFSSKTKSSLPQVLLLSPKKDTPVIWRVLSGLYRKSFIFFDAEVHDVADPALRRMKVDALPAVVGKLANGEVHVLKTGAVKDLKSGIDELRTVLDGLEKKNKKAASSQAQSRSHDESQQGYTFPLLTAANINEICSDNTVVCIIGVFRSFKAKEKLESLFHEVSQKKLTRLQNSVYDHTLSYSLLDAKKQKVFLDAFDRSGFKNFDALVVAYKPRRGKFALLGDDLSMERLEGFIGAVFNGDIEFRKAHKRPFIK